MGKYLNTRQTAEEFGISAKTLQNWRAKGYGPPYRKTGYRTIHYRWAEVEGWLDSYLVRTYQKPRLKI